MKQKCESWAFEQRGRTRRASWWRCVGLVWLTLLIELVPASRPAAAADGELYYGPGGVAKLKKLATMRRRPKYGPAPAAVIDGILKQANRWLTTAYHRRKLAFRYTFGATPPPRHRDSFPYWTALFQERRDSISRRIQTLTFAWLVTGQTKYLRAAEAMVLKLTAWPQWTDPDFRCYGRRACLDTAHAVMAVAYFYDAARSTLRPGNRARIRAALTKKGLNALAAAVRLVQRRSFMRNTDALVAVGLGVGAAALYREAPRAKAWLGTAVSVVKRFLDHQGLDGGLMEYHGYGAYALDAVTRLLLVAKHLGITVSHPALKRVSQFFLASLAPNGKGLGTFGDSWSNCGALLNFYLAAQGDQYAQAYLVDSGLIRKQNYVTVALADGNRPLKRLAPGIWIAKSVGFGALRSRADRKATLVVFKAGPRSVTIPHNQADHLSFQLWARGRWLLGDSGASRKRFRPAKYRFTETAVGHSTILVGHEGPQKKAGAWLSRYSGGEGFGVLCGRGESSYRSGLVTSIRRCLLMHPNGLVVLSDRIRTPRPQTVEWLFQPHVMGQAQVKPDGGVLSHGGAFLRIHTVGTGFSRRLQGFGMGTVQPSALVLAKRPPEEKRLGLANGSFESGRLDGWTNQHRRSGSFSVVQGGYRSGHAARFSARTLQSGGLSSQRLAIQPGDAVRARVYVQQVIRGTGTRIRLQFWRQGHALEEHHDRWRRGRWAWHRRTVAARVPAGADQVSVVLEVMRATGEVKFDAVDLTILGKGQMRSRTVRLAALLVTGQTGKKVLNGDFSRGFASWRRRGKTRRHHTIVKDVVHSAPAAARIEFSEQHGAGYLQGEPFPVTSGHRLSVRVWVRTRIESGRGARIRIAWFNGTEKRRWVKTRARAGETPWSPMGRSAVVPADVNRARIVLEFSGKGTVWFDDVTLEDSGTSGQAGSHPANVEIKGTPQAFTFRYAGANFLFVDATDSAFQGRTALGNARLEGGFALVSAMPRVPSVLVDARAFVAPNGLSATLSAPANLRFEKRGTELRAQVTPGTAGQRPTHVRLEIPDSLGVDAAKVNGQAVPITSTADGRHVACFGPGGCTISAAGTMAAMVASPRGSTPSRNASPKKKSKSKGCQCASLSPGADVLPWMPIILALLLILIFECQRRRRPPQ